MILLETNKKQLDLIQVSTPIINLFSPKYVNSKNIREQFYKEQTHFIHWLHHFPEVDSSKLKEKTEALTSIFKAPALGVKLMGSANQRNHIWIVTVDQRPYIFYLSLRGLNIETLPQVTAKEVLSDLKTIRTHFGFKLIKF